MDDAEPWPCTAARNALLLEFKGNRIGLALALASALELAQLEIPVWPEDGLYRQILGWHRGATKASPSPGAQGGR